MKFENNGSLERSLVRDFPGCKSVVQALQKVITEKQGNTALQPSEEYQIMLDAIYEITLASKDFDFDEMRSETCTVLSQMPLNDCGQVIRWKNAWLKVIAGR